MAGQETALAPIDAAVEQVEAAYQQHAPSGFDQVLVVEFSRGLTIHPADQAPGNRQALLARFDTKPHGRLDRPARLVLGVKAGKLSLLGWRSLAERIQVFQTDVSDLTFGADGLQGTLAIDLRIAALEAGFESDPRGDMRSVTGHDRVYSRRTLRLALQARSLKPAWAANLLFVGAHHGADVQGFIAGHASNWPEAKAFAPRWNLAQHELDATALEFDGTRLQGQLGALFHGDGYVPADGRSQPVAYAVDAVVRNSVLTGTWSTSRAQGTIRGSAGYLLDGFYQGGDAHGQHGGRLRVLMHGWSDKILLKPELDPAADVLTAAWAKLAYAAALTHARQHPATEFLSVLASCRTYTFVESAGQAELLSYWARLSQALIGAESVAQAPMDGGETQFHAAGSAACPLADQHPGRAELPTDGQWYWMPNWTHIGPMQVLASVPPMGPLLPEVVPGVSVSDKQGRHEWQPLSQDRRHLMLQQDKAGNRVRYLRTELQVAKAGAVTIALRVDDHGVLWVDGRRVWTSGSNPNRELFSLVTLSLQPGSHELLLRVRSKWEANHRFSYDNACRVEFLVKHGPCTVLAPPSVSPLAQPESQDGPFWQRPNLGPLVWDCEDGKNIVWSCPLEPGHAPLAHDGQVIALTEEPQGLVLIDRRDGQVLWRVQNEFKELVPDAPWPGASETMQAWVLAHRDRDKEGEKGKPKAKDSIWNAFNKWYKERGGQKAVALAGTAPVITDGKVYAYYQTGMMVAYTRTGERLWARDLGSSSSHAGPLAFVGLQDDLFLHRPYRLQAGKRSALARIDRRSGAVLWQTLLPDAIGLGLSAVEDAGVLVTPGGSVVDMRSGAVLATQAIYTAGVPATTWTSGQTVFFAQQHTQGALDVLRSGEQVYLRRRWNYQRWLNLLHSHAPLSVSPVEGGFLAWRIMDEFHGHHTRSYRTQLDLYAADTGQLLERLKYPSRSTMNPVVAPLVHKNIMYLYDPGDQARWVINDKHEHPQPRIQVLLHRPGRGMVPLLENRTPFGRAPLVMMDDQLLIRSERALFCVGVVGATARRAQAKEVAACITERLVNQRQPARMVKVIAPDSRVRLGAVTPWSAVTDRGLFHPGLFGIVAAGESLPSGLGDWLSSPAAATEKGMKRAFEPLPASAYFTAGKMTAKREGPANQSARPKHIYPDGVPGLDVGDQLILHTIITNDQERQFEVRHIAPKAQLFLAGQALANGERLQLAPGYYPLLWVSSRASIPKHLRGKVLIRPQFYPVSAAASGPDPAVEIKAFRHELTWARDHMTSTVAIQARNLLSLLQSAGE